MEDNFGLTCNFNVCSKCKSICCQDAKPPPITANRKKILRKYLKKENIIVKTPFITKNYSYPSVDEETYCRLFDKKAGKCKVHSVKPETCVAGPVTFNINFCTKKIEWFLKNKEICAYAEALFADKESFKMQFTIAKKQIIRLICFLSADELQTLMKIDEPQTFKFGEDDLPIAVVEKLGL